MTVFRNLNYSIILALTLFVSSASADEELQLVFGLYAAEKPTVLVKAFRPILTAIQNDLSASLGVKVKIRTHISSSYESGVAALVNGEVDFARFGPASYVTATEQNSELRILALDSKNATRTTEGIICVHEDSPFKDVSDLKGASFAFGNIDSTIGRYLSQAYLVNNGISAEELERYEYLERHDRVGHAVANGSFDAGALKESTFKKLVKNGLPLKAIASFKNVNKPWIAKSGMENELFEILQKVMFELSAPDAFKSLGSTQFVEGRDEDFSTIRDAIANNNKFFNNAVSIDNASTDVQ